MLDRILLNPDNRLLGASTGDLSLYGGQIDPSVVVREAPADTPPAHERGDGSGAQAAASAAQQSIAPHGTDPASTSVENLNQGGSGTPSSFLISAPAAFSPTAAPTHVIGGSEPAVTILQPVQPVQPIEAAVPQPSAAGSLAPAPDAAPPSALAVTAPVVDQVQGVQLPETLVSTPLANVQAVTDGAVKAVTDLAAATLPDVGAAVADVTDLAADLTSPALSGAGALVDGTAAAASDLVTATAGTAESALDQLAAAPAPLTGAVSPIAEVAGDAITATVQATTDTLEGLGGTDPAAGVATLVSLVSVSDMFDLHSVDAPEAQTPIDSGFGMLDSLAADDLLPDPLLGTHDDHAGQGDHLSDHPLGL